MDPQARTLIEVGDKLFSARPLSLWQVLAENFNPMRADFMAERAVDEEVSLGLMSSVPVLFCRELAESIAVNMRPRSVSWNDLHVPDEALDKRPDVRAFLEYVTGVQRRAMYDPRSGFVRATKEADADWVTIGNAVIHVGTNRTRDTLLYQNFHVRDVAWSEGPNRIIDTVHRNWNPTLRQMCQMFPGKVTPVLKEEVKRDPERTIRCRHIVVPRDNYVYKSKAAPKGMNPDSGFISIFLDMENEVILEEVPQSSLRYVIPRWKTVSGTAIGRSPVTEVMLPDARVLQTMSRIIIEAGEKAVDPAMIAAEEVFRSDFDVRAGGLTWAELEIDQKLSDKFDIISPDKNGIPIGIDMIRGMIQTLADGFYINKLKMPPAVREFTAYELRKRIQEHIRDVSPLYEPVEEEYNAPLCDETFEVLAQHKAFGDISQMPQELRGTDATFTFRSPLRDAEEELDAHVFGEGMNLVMMAAKVDPSQVKQVKLTQGVRDSLKGLRFKESWLAPIEEVEAAEQQNAQKQEMMEMGAMAGGAGQAAESIGKGAKETNAALTEAGGLQDVMKLLTKGGAPGGGPPQPPGAEAA